MEWLMENLIEEQSGLSLARMTVDVGVTSDLHQHDNCNEVIHVLAGTIDQRVGETWRTIETGGTCLIRLGEMHQSRNVGSDTVILMIAYSSGMRHYQSV